MNNISFYHHQHVLADTFPETVGEAILKVLLGFVSSLILFLL